ncbi:MAG TPA: PQQ-binding-like beta-propeller repeat protein [Candidatus Sulfotelmatobacter sp.]|nr:PQQ-binding-like beta-propeller repeat protein [Candidatus Sulfotelmatobacter sp.]
MKSTKKMAVVTAIILLTTSINLIATIPSANAELQIITTAYMSVRPNPIGLGQTILVNVWLVPAIHVSRTQTGYMVTFTKPDGTKDVVGPLNAYPGDSTAWFEYAVDQIGTWKVKFDYPGKHFPSANVSVAAVGLSGTIIIDDAYYLPSSTNEQTFAVQEAPVMSWPMSPLPTDYWTRPVSPENREWAPILGDYPWTGLGGGTNWPAETNKYASNYGYTPYVQAPSTAHIAWKRQGSISGIIGSDQGFVSMTGGGGTPNIIYQGRAFQSYTKPGTGTTAQSYWMCYDIRTGELYWERPLVTGESAPTVIEYSGTSASLLYIGNSRLIKYNPYTGAISGNYSISPLTTGTYYVNGYCLTVQDLGASKAPNQYRLINWTTLGSSTNFTTRIMSNISFPLSRYRQADYEAGMSMFSAFEPTPLGAWYGWNMSGQSLTTGQTLWNTVISGDSDSMYSPTCTVVDHGKIAICDMNRYWSCYDLASGKLLWRSEKADYPWGFGWAYAVESAYGLLYGQGYAGVFAYDWDTGKIVWQFKAPTPYEYETPYVDANGTGAYSFNGGALIADGKLYTYNTEHTPTQPITRGWRLFCINATTGEGIWNITGSMSAGAIADGYLAASNTYDGYMYVFGKGKSATTVTAPDVSVPLGTALTIKGAVLDQSPSQPNTPCVSKDSMTTQMEYLHMQHPIDGIDHKAQMTGVPVTLTAVDSKGEVTPIGTTITNAYYGTFSYEWTPSKQDKYTITTSFAGDDSYSSSGAATAVIVAPAPVTPDTSNQQQITVPDYTMTIIAGVIAVILAVAIAAIVLYRKK